MKLPEFYQADLTVVEAALERLLPQEDAGANVYSSRDAL